MQRFSLVCISDTFPNTLHRHCFLLCMKLKFFNHLQKSFSMYCHVLLCRGSFHAATSNYFHVVLCRRFSLRSIKCLKIVSSVHDSFPERRIQITWSPIQNQKDSIYHHRRLRKQVNNQTEEYELICLFVKCPTVTQNKEATTGTEKSRIISSPLRQASLSCYCILNICPQKGWKWTWKRRWEFKKMTTARVKGVKESSCRTLQASKNRRETVTAQCCSRPQLFTPAVRATRRHNEPSCCLCEEIQRRRLCPTSGPPTSERVNTTELRALFKDTPSFRPALRSGLI